MQLQCNILDCGSRIFVTVDRDCCSFSERIKLNGFNPKELYNAMESFRRVRIFVVLKNWRFIIFGFIAQFGGALLSTLHIKAFDESRNQ